MIFFKYLSFVDVTTGINHDPLLKGILDILSISVINYHFFILQMYFNLVFFLNAVDNFKIYS